MPPEKQKHPASSCTKLQLGIRCEGAIVDFLFAARALPSHLLRACGAITATRKAEARSGTLQHGLKPNSSFWVSSDEEFTGVD